jgi:hypothetical protein
VKSLKQLKTEDQQSTNMEVEVSKPESTDPMQIDSTPLSASQPIRETFPTNRRRACILQNKDQEHGDL